MWSVGWVPPIYGNLVFLGAGAASRRGKSDNLFVKISGLALTFCKNLAATPNLNQPNCEFTQRKRRIPFLVLLGLLDLSSLLGLLIRLSLLGLLSFWVF